MGTSNSFSEVGPKAEKFKKLTGIITDNQGHGIANALISVFGISGICTRSDSVGRFEFDLPFKKFGLCIDHICYCGKSISIDSKHIKGELKVVLSENIHQINFITGIVSLSGCEERPKMAIPKLNFEESLEELIVMELPEFRGGIQNFIKIVRREKQNVLDMGGTSFQGINGEFHGTFVVAKTGFVNNVKLDGEVSATIVQALEDIFSRAGKWKPGVQMGIPVDVKYSFVVEI